MACQNCLSYPSGFSIGVVHGDVPATIIAPGPSALPGSFFGEIRIGQQTGGKSGMANRERRYMLTKRIKGEYTSRHRLGVRWPLILRFAKHSAPKGWLARMRLVPPYFPQSRLNGTPSNRFRC